MLSCVQTSSQRFLQHSWFLLLSPPGSRDVRHNWVKYLWMTWTFWNHCCVAQKLLYVGRWDVSPTKNWKFQDSKKCFLSFWAALNVLMWVWTRWLTAGQKLASLLLLYTSSFCSQLSLCFYLRSLFGPDSFPPAALEHLALLSLVFSFGRNLVASSL